MIKTVETVNVNNGLIGTIPVILHGKIKEAYWTNSFEMLTVTGEYYYYDNNETKVIVKQFSWQLNKDGINDLYDNIVVPNEDLKTDLEKNLLI